MPNLRKLNTKKTVEKTPCQKKNKEEEMTMMALTFNTQTVKAFLFK